MPKKIKSVLFDLDGTLLDTAPDLTFVLNQLRKTHQLDNLEIEIVRPLVSKGLKAMLHYALGIDENHPAYKKKREQFFELYQFHLADSTQFFTNMDKVLDYLEQHHLPWGIVTNKLTQYTLLLLKALRLDHRPACIVCGDTLSKSKPNPDPILYALELLHCLPENCIFIGDSANDIIASKSAGTHSLVALYGYIDTAEKPLNWHADGYIHDPIEIIRWIEKLNANIDS